MFGFFLNFFPFKLLNFSKFFIKILKKMLLQFLVNFTSYELKFSILILYSYHPQLSPDICWYSLGRQISIKVFLNFSHIFSQNPLKLTSDRNIFKIFWNISSKFLSDIFSKFQKILFKFSHRFLKVFPAFFEVTGNFIDIFSDIIIIGKVTDDHEIDVLQKVSDTYYK